MTFECVKEDIEHLRNSLQKQTHILHNRLDNDLNAVWYFIIATIVLTSIGIISVLTYLGV